MFVLPSAIKRVITQTVLLILALCAIILQVLRVTDNEHKLRGLVAAGEFCVDRVHGGACCPSFTNNYAPWTEVLRVNLARQVYRAQDPTSSPPDKIVERVFRVTLDDLADAEGYCELKCYLGAEEELVMEYKLTAVPFSRLQTDVTKSGYKVGVSRIICNAIDDRRCACVSRFILVVIHVASVMWKTCVSHTAARLLHRPAADRAFCQAPRRGRQAPA